MSRPDNLPRSSGAPMDYHYPLNAVGSIYRILESTVGDILSFIKPSEEDKLKRQSTINEFTSALQLVEKLKGATVQPFGSYVSDLYSKWGDLDLYIELSDKPSGVTSKANKRILLRDIMKALQRTGWGHKFQYIPLARVPLLIFESNQGISCDITIDNHVAQLKSKILLWITQIDGRFRDLVLLIKEWAKAHYINDPKAGTLNSYSLCLLVIFHLQTCEPAILPPFKVFFPSTDLCELGGRGSAGVRLLESSYAVATATFKTSNKSSLSELLISFFEKFSNIETRASLSAICTYTGKWERIWSKCNWTDKSYSLIIEDPFQQLDNAARAVGAKELPVIGSAFMSTHLKLSRSSMLSDRASLLSCLLRPHLRLQLHFTRMTTERSNGNTSRQVDTLGGSDYEEIDHHFQSVLKLDKHRSHPDASPCPIQTKDVINVPLRSYWRPRQFDI